MAKKKSSRPRPGPRLRVSGVWRATGGGAEGARARQGCTNRKALGVSADFHDVKIVVAVVLHLAISSWFG